MVQMKLEHWFLLKHVSVSEEKVHYVNYITRSPPLIDEYYYRHDTTWLMIRHGFQISHQRFQLRYLVPYTRKKRLELWKLQP